jgi:hypothetical protein
MKTINFEKKSKNEFKKLKKKSKKIKKIEFSPPYLNLTPSFQISSPILGTLHITNNKG